MTEGIPQPEMDHRPGAPFLRLEVMTTEQITETAIAITEYGEAVAKEAGSARQIEICDSLMDGLSASMRDHAMANPVRARDLIGSFAHRRERALQRVAAESVDSLLDFDYGFTRDTLTWLAGWNDQSSYYEGIEMDGTAKNVARTTIRQLMRDRLTPEQAKDFNRSLVALGSTSTDPLQPGERF